MSQIAKSIFVAVVFVAAGGGADSSSAVSSPEELAGNTVAVVSQVPVSLGRITKVELQRAVVEGAAAAGRNSAPKPGGDGYEKLKDDAVVELLDGVWIRGQAAEMGITVTPRQVSRTRALLIRQSFESKAQYYKFLKEAHYTRRDVRERVEIQLFSTAIQRRISRRGRGETERLEAFEEFVEAYSKRWRARTICASGYVNDQCSNGPPPADGT